ncbi:Dyp-type peroxidase [Saccharibacter sp. 17.LH.SD]|uniref:Dyp-type peroxidase n=1 Tax=Saccharibacter sp. 17.LH.SD TaxID=2689393 RepID=UPI00136EBE11|nr:Dyp-type peroxidase [Saccharibacter sp. 17.LH.SD]MXV44991.1 Dyp-type peroxidase [Saccharibacter sp. 17.LH.SD]
MSQKHSISLNRRHFIRGLCGAATLGSLPLSALAKSTLHHQPGITTPQQPFLYFITFDLKTDNRRDVITLMQRWSDMAASLINEKTPPTPVDSGETIGLPSPNLTLTFGFGPGLFIHEGKDRYDLLSRRPAALADLPRFNGDQLIAARSGGDLCVQSCANDPQSAFHAARSLTRAAYGIAEPRWSQAGFLPHFSKNQTPRNLMGFKDGTINPDTHSPKVADKYIWADPKACPWMEGGSYLVARIIRIALEHWDQMKVSFQEETMGRQKKSGAPIGGVHEFDPLTLKQTDKDGNLLTAENSHARLAAPEENDGAQLLRRAYAYNNGLSFTAERWPPWRQGNEFDAGLLFLCYQQDPRTAFTKIFERMAKFDMMNQFTTHIGSALFACPGREDGHYIGASLLEG